MPENVISHYECSITVQHDLEKERTISNYVIASSHYKIDQLSEGIVSRKTPLPSLPENPIFSNILAFRFGIDKLMIMAMNHEICRFYTMSYSNSIFDFPPLTKITKNKYLDIFMHLPLKTQLCIEKFSEYLPRYERVSCFN